jgi:hypothetical protein
MKGHSEAALGELIRLAGASGSSEVGFRRGFAAFAHPTKAASRTNWLPYSLAMVKFSFALAAHNPRRVLR